LGRRSLPRSILFGLVASGFAARDKPEIRVSWRDFVPPSLLTEKASAYIQRIIGLMGRAFSPRKEMI
jgi:hypothetical protein